MDCRIQIAATLLEKQLIHHELGVNTDFCHIHRGDQASQCYQGKAFGSSWSWLICDECMDKINNVPKEKMFTNETLLKQELEKSNVELEQYLTTIYVH